jgi:hypothetical protein
VTHVAIDIDDTLYSFCQAARQELIDWPGEDAQRAKQAAYSIWSDWRSAGELCNGFFDDVIAKVHEDDCILSQEPFKDAVDVLNEICEAGNEITYISTRAPKTYDATAQWLDNCGFPAGNLICTFESKIPRVRHCQYIIDDRAKTLVEFVYDFDWKYKHGSQNDDMRRLGFGLHVTQNLSLTDVPGVYLAPSWALLRTYLVEKGQLLNA